MIFAAIRHGSMGSINTPRTNFYINLSSPLNMVAQANKNNKHIIQIRTYEYLGMEATELRNFEGTFCLTVGQITEKINRPQIETIL